MRLSSGEFERRWKKTKAGLRKQCGDEIQLNGILRSGEWLDVVDFLLHKLEVKP